MPRNDTYSFSFCMPLCMTAVQHYCCHEGILTAIFLDYDGNVAFVYVSIEDILFLMVFEWWILKGILNIGVLSYTMAYLMHLIGVCVVYGMPGMT